MVKVFSASTEKTGGNRGGHGDESVNSTPLAGVRNFLWTPFAPLSSLASSEHIKRCLCCSFRSAAQGEHRASIGFLVRHSGIASNDAAIPQVRPPLPEH